MSQNDFNLANQGFPSMRADMNSALQALASNSSGATSPATTYAYQWWYDDANDILKFRNGDNDAWIDFASFNHANDSWFIPSVDITGGTIDGTVIGGSTPAAISGTTGAFSADVTLPSINGGPLAGFRNAIINGNFDHWQRGTSGTAGYVSDRWRTIREGSTAAISRQAFTLGQIAVPNEPEYFHRVVVTSVAGDGNLVVMQQRVEDVRTFAGQTVTLSFFAKADAAKNIAVEFAQDFGTGGSAAVFSVGVTTISLTTSFQKFTVTATIPSIAGKTIGSQSSLDLSFFFDSGSNFNARNNSLGQQSGTFDIAQVQLEAGSVATPFERRPVGTELALCQRYYSRVDASFRFDAVLGVNNAADGGVLYFPTTMRATPTVSVVSETSSNAGNVTGFVGTNASSTTAVYLWTNGTSSVVRTKGVLAQADAEL